MSFAFTPEGHAALAAVVRHLGMSRSDSLELLVRREAARLAAREKSVAAT